MHLSVHLPHPAFNPSIFNQHGLHAFRCVVFQHLEISSIKVPSAWRVQPRNYLLFACHLTNTSAQLVQEARFVNYWYMGGKEAKEKEKGPVTQAIEATKEEAQKVSAAK